MKRCDPNVRAQCPDREHCELYAEFADGSDCNKFQEQILTRPMTNADRIRAMSDEELTDFMYDFNFLDDCRECVLDWLHSPVKEDSDGRGS